MKKKLYRGWFGSDLSDLEPPDDATEHADVSEDSGPDSPDTDAGQ